CRLLQRRRRCHAAGDRRLTGDVLREEPLAALDGDRPARRQVDAAIVHLGAAAGQVLDDVLDLHAREFAGDPGNVDAAERDFTCFHAYSPSVSPRFSRPLALLARAAGFSKPVADSRGPNLDSYSCSRGVRMRWACCAERDKTVARVQPRTCRY